MILVDTSIWVDHLRVGDDALGKLLNSGQVLIHPFVIGELALGNLRQRQVILTSLHDLPHAVVATHQEALHFIEQNSLIGLGIGYVDIHLLASCRLTPDTLLWTRDKRLLSAAQRLGLIGPQSNLPLTPAPPSSS